MKLLAFDIEGYLFSDTDKAPKPVCCSWADESRVWITDPSSMETTVAWAQPDNLFIGQNIAYDLICMLRWHPKLTPDIIRALAEGRVFDTAMRERLLHLREFGGKGYPMFPSLADLTLKYLHKDLSAEKHGDDIWRMKYGTLDGVPFREWPQKALDYAMGDPRHTYDVFQAQGGIRNIQATEILQVQAAVVLQAIGTWGFAVNQEKRLKIKTALEAKTVALHKKIDAYQWTGPGSQKRMMDLVSWAWHYKHFKILQDRGAVTGVTFDLPTWEANIPKTTNIKALLLQAVTNRQPLPGMLCAQGVDWAQWCKEAITGLPEIPMVKKGVSIAGEVLEQLGDVVAEFKSLTELKHIEKMISNYIEPYEGRTVHPSFVTLVTTGRTGCRSPNTQNIPRKDEDRADEGFRTMFEARPGTVLGTSDYSQLELCTLAATFRTMFPNIRSTLGDAIDKGMDVHCITGGMIAGLSYEQMMAGKKTDKRIKDYRQGAKACIAKGSPVLTLNGKKPIESVTVDDKIWDGMAWVKHDGVVYKGVKTVIADDGGNVAFTPDHLLYVGDETISWGDAIIAPHALLERAAKDGRPEWFDFEEACGRFVLGSMFVTEVYDIVNAGPRHRFQCGPFIVSNCNFGLPGGLGAGTFVSYAEDQYNVKISMKDAWSYIHGWKRTWPEIPNVYLKYASDQTSASHTGTFTSYTITGRPKALCYYCDGSNYPFQGLAADGAKASLWALWKEAMLGFFWGNNAGSGFGLEFRDSPLNQSRLVNFVHDEVICEHPKGEQGKAALKRQDEIMVAEMTRICANKITIRVESALSDAWEH